jgi:hypothetical protein
MTAANGGPVYVEGERVERVHVAAGPGGDSRASYVTATGREIAPAGHRSAIPIGLGEQAPR